MHLKNGNVPIDNNHVQNLMRPWTMGRKAWLFAGSELAGQRAAVVMSLLQSAKLNGHDRRGQQHAYDYAGANRRYGLDSPLGSFKVVWLAAYQCAARLGKYCVCKR